MEYRVLGRSGLKVSTLTLGTMTFGGEAQFAKLGNVEVDAAKRMIGMSKDAGVNMIDTADLYSFGRSEEIIGEALVGQRDDWLITTKVRFPMADGPNDAGLSRHHIIRSCDNSLRRLRTDYLDLYQLHEWDGITPVEEMLEALDHLVQSGKVRYVGASNFSAWHMMKALGVSDRLHLPRFISQQIHYTAQAREAEYELVPLALDQGVGIMVWAPIAGGLLTGKYRRNVVPAEGRVVNEWNEPPIRDEDALFDIIDVIVDIAEKHGVPPVHVALAYTLAKPGVTTLVVGARTEEQLATNLAVADFTLPAEDFSRLDDVSRPPLIYPYWHQARNASDRLSFADLTLIGPFLEGRGPLPW